MIGELMALRLTRPHLISLAAGFVDQDSLPIEATREMMNDLLADVSIARSALQYGSTSGLPELRRMILDRHLRQERKSMSSSSFSIEQVVCTAGSNQLLHLVCDSLFDPGDIVLCATPTYLVALGIFRYLGVRAIGISTDEEGIIPEALDEALERLNTLDELHRVKAIYVVSYFDNPCGMTMPIERRGQMVEIAKRWSRKARIHIIEDGAYRELRYEGDDLPSMVSFDTDRDTVIYAGTFSKAYSPGLRVGWGILPPHLVDPVCQMKANIDFGSPNFNQYLIAKLMEFNRYEPHIESLRRRYRSKRNAMISAAEKSLRAIPAVSWEEPTGGLYVWLQLPEFMDAGHSGTLLARAMDYGVFYVPGEYFFAGEGMEVQRQTIRLSFGAQDEKKIEQGIGLLAKAIHDEISK